MNRVWRFNSCVAVAGAIALMSSVVHAADSPAQPGGLEKESQSGETSGTQLEQVVVTAQRRDESADRVPIAIATISPAKLESLGVGSLHELGALVPGLTFDRSSSGIIPALRGIGTTTVLAGDEPVTAVYIDGVYVLASQANAFDLPNVERIEVVKGPQGTLFGRNAVGGVIQIVTKTPSATPSFKAALSYGSYETIGGDFYGTTGLSENVAADMTVHYRRNYDGWGKNVLTGEDTYRAYDIAVLTKLAWDLGEATRVIGSFSDTQDRSQLGINTRLVPGALGRDGVSRGPAGFWDVNTNLDPYVKVHTTMGSLKITHDFGWATLSNLAAYQKTRDDQVADIDATPSDLHSQRKVFLYTDALTNELQLLSAADSPLSWIVGTFYMDSKAGYDPARLSGLVFPPPYLDLINRQDTESYAIYGQATAPLTSRLRATVGGRWTNDERRVEGAFFRSNGAAVGGVKVARESWSSPSGRVSLDYDLQPNLLGYVSYNRGFKSGVFNLVAPGDPPVDPTTVNAYELGLKGNFLNRRVRFDLAGFYYRLSDIQLRTFNPATNLARTTNAADSEIYGLDVSIDAAVTDRLTLSAAAEALKTRYISFPNAILSEPRPAGGNNQSGWAPDDSNWDVRLWGTNLTNEKYYVFMGAGTDNAAGDACAAAPPRTYGVTVTMRR